MAKSKKQKSQPKEPVKGEFGNVFVGYPPSLTCLLRDLPSLPNTYVMPDKKRSTLGKLDAAVNQFRQTKNLEKAVTCLIAANWLNVYPPRDVQEWLAKSLEDLMEGRGSLDACLQLKKKRGRPPSKLTRQKYLCIWQDVFRWTKGLGLPQYQAFAIVAPYFGMTAQTFDGFQEHEDRFSQWHQCRREMEIEIDRYMQECEVFYGEKILEEEDLDSLLRKYNIAYLEKVRNSEGSAIDLKNEILPKIRERYQSMGRWYGQPSDEVVSERIDRNIRTWDSKART